MNEYGAEKIPFQCHFVHHRVRCNWK